MTKGVDNVEVFHAGTAIKQSEDEETVVTSGGRVMAIVGLAEGIKNAQKTAYEGIKKISFDDIQYRNDIASRACRYVQRLKIVLSGRYGKVDFDARQVA